MNDVTGFAPQPITLEPTPKPANDWQRASELFMPLRLQGANVALIVAEYCEVSLWQAYNLEGARLPEYRSVQASGDTLTEAMERAIEQWRANYGNQE